MSSCDIDEIFRLFTLPAQDFHKQFLILDVRDAKTFKKEHINQAFCVRVSTNGKVLADYSSAEYHTKWAQDVWVGRTVYVYGEAGLKKDHPVVEYLLRGSCKEVKYLKEGYEAFLKTYPCLCTPSIKANSIKAYPSQIVAGLLYLGDWGHAEAAERLADLNIRNVVTIHNHPENLKSKLGKGVKWLTWELPDVDTADITPCFNRTFEFIEEARHRKEAVLVHCGAGVSRSATLCMMYLMRRFSWNAAKAKEHCVERRPVVCPNDGFWRTLCGLEPALGITNRSDPEAGTTGFRGDDAAPVPKVGEEAVGGKVPVRMVEAADVKRQRDAGGDAGAAGADAKRAKTEAGAAAAGRGRELTVEIEVHKPDGLVGKLVVGPLGPHQRCIFGRLPSNDVVAEHASISRQHAVLTADMSGALLLTDLQSGHGTNLDGVWVKANQPKLLRVGSVFKLGASSRSYKVVSIVKG